MASHQVTQAEPVTPCAACEVGKASILLPSGAPVCGDCYLALGRPKAPITQSTEPDHEPRW